MTQALMGQHIGISSNYVYMIESGRSLPSPHVLERFSAFFGFNRYLLLYILYKDRVEEYSQGEQKKLGLDKL